MLDLLRLDLQFFAEPPAPADPPATPPADPPTDPNPQGNEPGGNEPPTEKTFTQKELNAIAAKESKSAIEKFLKDNGFTDFNNAKEGMAKFKEWNESQKTEAQKQAEKLQEIEGTNTNLSKENTTLKAQLAAVTNGVHADFTDDVVALAERQVTDEIDINQAIKNVVEKYPHFKGQAQEQNQGPTFSNNNFQRQTGSVDPFVAALGLKQS